MKNPFKKEIANFKSEQPVTPYQLAEQEWDARIGMARSQAKSWRMMAMFAMVVAVLVVLILLAVLAKSKDRIYIAEVTQGGRVVNVAPLTVAYQPNEAQKEYFVAQFIGMVRGLPLDPVVAKKSWLTAYNFLTQRGAERLNEYFKQNNPIAMLGKKTVTVQIVDVDQVSDSSLHVNWIETTINASGQEEGKKNYSGMFTLSLIEPTTQEEILQNPLGIYILDFDISSTKSG